MMADLPPDALEPEAVLDARQTAIYDLSQTPDLLQQLVLDVPEARFDDAMPGAWSARLVLAHLLAVEWQTFRLRLERTLSEDQPVVTPFDARAWAARQQQLPLERVAKVVTDFSVQRAASVRMLENVSPDDWARTMLHSEHGPFTLDELLQLWVRHDQQHLDQLTALLDRPDA